MKSRTLCRVLATGALMAAPSVAAGGKDVGQSLLDCHVLTGAAARLACYDRLAADSVPPRWAGRLSFSTEAFQVDRPTWLRFDSEGVIFVMSLKDANGEVVQNLHHAGAGEGRYLIARPGTYSLQINGAEGWRIWLEPTP